MDRWLRRAYTGRTMQRAGILVRPRSFLRGALALTGLGLLSGCALPGLPGRQAARVHRIGFLTGGSRASDAAWTEAFLRGLGELGYAEGRNVVLEYRYGEGKTERFPSLVAELVRLDFEVVVVCGATASRAAKQGTVEIPVVMTNVTDPAALGLVASLAHPGGNLTGLTNF